MAGAGVQQHLAFFNWSEEHKRISVSADQAGLPVPARLTDFWTDEVAEVTGEFISVTLEPHSAALYTVRAT